MSSTASSAGRRTHLNAIEAQVTVKKNRARDPRQLRRPQASKGASMSGRWFGGEPARARAMGRELLEMKSELIVAAGTPGLAALAQETRTVPVVFVAVSDPVGQGFVASLARPGGNATGFTFLEFSVIGKLLEVLKQIAPSVARVALPFTRTRYPTSPFCVGSRRLLHHWLSN
jgi:hypothetical protein